MWHLFPSLVLNVESVHAPEYASLVESTHHKGKFLNCHTAQGEVGSLSGHRSFLSHPEALVIDPAAALDVAFAHLEKLCSDLNRDPALVTICRLVTSDFFLSSGARSVGLDVNYIARIRVPHAEEE